MHAGKLIFAQLTEYLPLTTFRRCVARYLLKGLTNEFMTVSIFLHRHFLRVNPTTC
jgi:hypothetical protein